PTVDEVLLAYWKHAKRHYRDGDGRPTDELDNIKAALKPLRRLYGPTIAKSFGPLALRAVRDEMVRSGLARPTVNARVNKVRRAFKVGRLGRVDPGGGHPGAGDRSGAPGGPHRGARARPDRRGVGRDRRGDAAVPAPARGRDGQAPIALRLPRRRDD